jgi:hypothetical protein
MFIEVLFLLDLVGSFLAIDVVRGEKNFQEAEMALMKPRVVPDRQGLISHGTTTLPSTLPTKSLRNTGIYGPLHISTTVVALHLTPKQAHVL